MASSSGHGNLSQRSLLKPRGQLVHGRRSGPRELARLACESVCDCEARLRRQGPALRGHKQGHRRPLRVVRAPRRARRRPVLWATRAALCGAVGIRPRRSIGDVQCQRAGDGQALEMHMHHSHQRAVGHRRLLFAECLPINRPEHLLLFFGHRSQLHLAHGRRDVVNILVLVLVLVALVLVRTAAHDDARTAAHGHQRGCERPPSLARQQRQKQHPRTQLIASSQHESRVHIRSAETTRRERPLRRTRTCQSLGRCRRCALQRGRHQLGR